MRFLKLLTIFALAGMLFAGCASPKQPQALSPDLQLEDPAETPRTEDVQAEPTVQTPTEQPEEEKTAEKPKEETTKEEAKVEKPVEKPKEEAKVEKPAEKPEEEAKAEKPVEKPKEEAKVEKPVEKPKEEAKVEKPAEKPKEEAKVEKPAEKPKEEAKEDLKEEPLPAPPAEVVVPILMFHDVKSYAGGSWSMSAENFENTLLFLLEKGYSPIFFDQLADYAAGTIDLPEKPVCITLDDGYYSNYKYVLPIVTRLEVPVTVFVTCGTVREEGTEPDANEAALSKLSVYEMAVMEGSPFIKMQSHTYAMHGNNTSYGEGIRESVLPLAAEDKASYQQIFSEDCALAEGVLNAAGVLKHTVFSYPNGKAHAWSEEVLRERGYRVSLTTDYSRVNTVKKGVPSSAYLLGRMNVNDATSQEALLKYLER